MWLDWLRGTKRYDCCPRRTKPLSLSPSSLDATIAHIIRFPQRWSDGGGGGGCAHNWTQLKGRPSGIKSLDRHLSLYSNERLWEFISSIVVATRRINCFSGCADVKQSPIISICTPPAHYYFPPVIIVVILTLQARICVWLTWPQAHSPRLECNYQVFFFISAKFSVCVCARSLAHSQSLWAKNKAGIFVLKVTVMDTGRDFMFGCRCCFNGACLPPLLRHLLLLRLRVKHNSTLAFN